MFLMLLLLMLLQTDLWLGRESYTVKLYQSILLILLIIPVTAFRLHLSDMTLSELIDQFSDSSLFIKTIAVILLILFCTMIIALPFIK